MSSVLLINQISMSFGPLTVLENVSFVLNEGDRAGLVGANGAGKSTLMRIVAGEQEPDAGTCIPRRGTTIGYLPQQPPDPEGATLHDIILESVGELRQLETRLRELEVRMSDPHATDIELERDVAEYGECQERFERRGGYDLDYRIDIVLSGLAIAQLPKEREFQSLSGGEKARVQLAALLLRSPDLLLLDEPTNHLDFASIAWLEGYLSGYGGTVLVISHDRHFLNGTVNRVLEVDEHTHTLREYVGNYDGFLLAKQREREQWEIDWLAQQDEVRDLKRAIRLTARQVGHNRPARDGDKTAYDFFGGRVQGAVSRNVRNLEERLRRIEADPLPKPPDMLRISPDFEVDELRSAEILRVSGVSKSFGDTSVLDDVSFSLGPRQRVVIVGPNGAGKSTLLQIIAGQLCADHGTVTIANGVEIGYLDQESRAADDGRTVLETYRAGLVGYEDEFIRDLFRYGLFTLDDLSKQVRFLSAGQRRKLQIARLVAARVNVLLLDEPTNHLSFDILEEFERALAAFAGPILAVSHDRWFIQRFGGQVWELRDGRIIRHAGNADDALESMLRQSSAPASR